MFSPATSSPSRVAPRSSVDVVAAGGRALDVGELPVAAQLGLHGLVDLGVGGRAATGSSTRSPS